MSNVNRLHLSPADARFPTRAGAEAELRLLEYEQVLQPDGRGWEVLILT